MTSPFSLMASEEEVFVLCWPCVCCFSWLCSFEEGGRERGMSLSDDSVRYLHRFLDVSRRIYYHHFQNPFPKDHQSLRNRVNGLIDSTDPIHRYAFTFFQNVKDATDEKCVRWLQIYKPFRSRVAVRMKNAGDELMTVPAGLFMTRGRTISKPKKNEIKKTK